MRGEINARGISVVGCGNSVRDEVTGTVRTVDVVVISLVIYYTGQPNNRDVNGAEKTLRFFGLDSRMSTQDKY